MSQYFFGYYVIRYFAVTRFEFFPIAVAIELYFKSVAEDNSVLLVVVISIFPNRSDMVYQKMFTHEVDSIGRKVVKSYFRVLSRCSAKAKCSSDE